MFALCERPSVSSSPWIEVFLLVKPLKTQKKREKGKTFLPNGLLESWHEHCDPFGARGSSVFRGINHNIPPPSPRCLRQ